MAKIVGLKEIQFIQDNEEKLSSGELCKILKLSYPTINKYRKNQIKKENRLDNTGEIFKYKCSKCNIFKLLTNEYFWKDNNKTGFSSQCKKCKSFECVKRYKRKVYKLTNEEIIKFDSQKTCDICRKDNARDIDHCHSTGKVRGKLCTNCNLALGNFKDNIENLENAIKYLKK